MESIHQVFCSLQNFIVQGFHSLPIILGGAILLLGLMQGNINFLFLFVGLMILAPLGASLLNLLLEFIFPNKTKIAGTAQQCSMFTYFPNPSSPAPINVIPSVWMTVMAFFFTYLFQNALTLYQKQSNSKAPEAAVNARKSQAMMSMIFVVGAAIVITIFRYAKTSCETSIGLLTSWLVGGLLAWGWYDFMRKCGLGRLDDIFGISNRILPMQSYEENTPVTCVPAAE